jgi:hypothetical protein
LMYATTETARLRVCLGNAYRLSVRLALFPAVVTN